MVNFPPRAMYKILDASSHFIFPLGNIRVFVFNHCYASLLGKLHRKNPNS